MRFDPVATAPGSDFVSPRYFAPASTCIMPKIFPSVSLQ
jgi:hypothetical protein